MEEISFFQTTYDFIMQNQSLSYWIIFLSTVLEATVFLGLAIPAALLMIVFGFISYGGYLVGAYVILVAILGAIVGDFLNYFLGLYHTKKHEIKNIEKIDDLLKKKSYLDHGKEFFKKHGGKSVFFGRFIGVMRPFISFIAGGSKMLFLRFAYFNILGATLWVLLYFGIGYLFGSSVEAAASWIDTVENFILVILFVGISFLYLRNIARQKVKPKVLEKSEKILEKIEKKD